MSREMITLSAEVEEVLRDVARRPGSGLLRVPRKDVARTVLERGAVAHARAAGMSAAERHLVQAHREEVAFVLRQAAHLMICEDAIIGAFAVNRAVPELRAPLAAHHEMRIAASGLVQSNDIKVRDCGATEILELLLRGELGQWPSLGQIAASAHRLVPTQSSRLNAALHARVSGEFAQSRLIFGEILAIGGSSAVMGMAWTNLSDVYLAVRDSSSGLRAARRATELLPQDLAPRLNHLLCAMSVEDIAGATAMLIQLARVPLTAEMSSCLRARRPWRNSAVQVRSRALFGDIARDAGPLAEEWVHALIDS